MSDWMRTKVRLKNTTEIIIKYLPRMTVALEEIAKSLKLKWSEQEILRLAEEEQSNFGGEKDEETNVLDEYAEDIDNQACAQGRKSSINIIKLERI